MRYRSFAIQIPYIYAPEYCIQKGMSEEMASYLISVIGIVNTFGIVGTARLEPRTKLTKLNNLRFQVIVGYIGDKSWIKVTNLYSLFTTISGFSIFFFPLLQNYASFFVAAAIYGFSISVNYTLITVILVDILGIERFTNGYGFLLLVQGCSTLIGPPLAGKCASDWPRLFQNDRPNDEKRPVPIVRLTECLLSRLAIRHLRLLQHHLLHHRPVYRFQRRHCSADRQPGEMLEPAQPVQTEKRK